MLHSQPFDYLHSTPYSKMVGRRALLEMVTDDLIAGENSYIIVGGRHFGKSSFLNALEHTLLTHIESVKQNDWYVLPVLIDVKGLVKRSPEGVFGLLLKTLYKYFDPLRTYPEIKNIHFNMLSKNNEFYTFTNNSRKDCTIDEFVSIIDELSSIFSNSCGSLRIVFVLDDVEKIVLHQDSAEELFDYLRFLIDGHPLKNFIRYVIAGSTRVMEMRQQGSPFLNMLEVPSGLRRLENIDIQEIINWAGSVPEEAAAMVIKQSGGHPFIAQYLMYHLWKKDVSLATSASVYEIARRFIHDRHEDLKYWLSCIPKPGPDVYRVLMEAQTEYGLTEAHIQHLLGASSWEALRALCYHGLIDHDGTWSTYRIVGEAFKSWFELNELPALSHNHTTYEATSAPAVSKPINVFCLYANEDKVLAERLEMHLTLLRQQSVIDDWHRGKINPGQEEKREIEEHWERARVILLLVSVDLMISDTSDFIRRAMERHKAKTSHVIPVILKPVLYEGAPFEGLIALPRNKKPISGWLDPNEAFTEISQAVRLVVKELRGQS